MREGLGKYRNSIDLSRRRRRWRRPPGASVRADYLRRGGKAADRLDWSAAAWMITGSAKIGTPSDIADAMQEWFENGACDGFNITPAHLPGGCEDFVELVVPEL